VFINWLTEARDAPPRPSDRMTGSVMDGFRPFDDLFAWTDRGPLWIMCSCFCSTRPGPDEFVGRGMAINVLFPERRKRSELTFEL
jgi:hypothetical protein